MVEAARKSRLFSYRWREFRLRAILAFLMKLMEINEEQMPPRDPKPPLEKGVPRTPAPESGSKPDMKYPERQEQGDEPVDPVPDMDPDGMDPDEDEAVN
jgi:hypothetical protein